MKPTNKFRWLIFSYTDYRGEHPSGFSHGERQGRVLQQMWESDSTGEWRDIPMEEE